MSLQAVDCNEVQGIIVHLRAVSYHNGGITRQHMIRMQFVRGWNSFTSFIDVSPSQRAKQGADS